MTTTSATHVFAIDPTHSSVNFSVRHLMISKVRGTFTGVTGTVSLAEGSNIPTAISAEIDASSIDTNESQRDGHLKSPDFLNVEEHTHIHFTSTSVEAKGADHFTVTGALTIHGVTKTVALEGTVEGRGIDPWGNDRIGFSATTKINRKDYGLTWNQTLETGGLMIGEDVAIELDIEAVPAK